MDPNNPIKPEPTKLKFRPKAPPKAPRRLHLVKKEEPADDVLSKKEELMRRFHDLGGKAKFDKKPTPPQVSFGQDADSMRSYGSRQASVVYKGPGGSTSSAPKAEKEYEEPWDYYSDYPVSIPLRPPYSGDPEALNEAEFGEAAQNKPYDEDSIDSARELGLTEQNEGNEIFFFQLPSIMSMIKRSAAADGTNIDSKNPSRATGRVEKPCKFDELPEGFMGKMLVYKSGKVKLKIGDTLYDSFWLDTIVARQVSPGVDCSFAQEVVAINVEEKNFAVMGELNKRAVVVPDIDSILNSTSI